MFNLRERLYRVTTAGTATINGKTEHFPLGRFVDTARYDMVELNALGITTTRVLPA